MQKNRKYARDIQIFRVFVLFYSREHEPVHVHVEGADGFAKYEYNGEKFELHESRGIKTGDLKKIKFVIDDNADIIVARWNEYFNR